MTKTKKTTAKKAVKTAKTTKKTTAKAAAKATKKPVKKARIAKKAIRTMNQEEKREYWRTVKRLQAKRSAK